MRLWSREGGGSFKEGSSSIPEVSVLNVGMITCMFCPNSSCRAEDSMADKEELYNQTRDAVPSSWPAVAGNASGRRITNYGASRGFVEERRQMACRRFWSREDK